MQECPECDHGDSWHKGEVATEVWDCFGGIWEPVEKWITCDNCHGLGEVEKDEF